MVNCRRIGLLSLSIIGATMVASCSTSDLDQGAVGQNAQRVQVTPPSYCLVSLIAPGIQAQPNVDVNNLASGTSTALVTGNPPQATFVTSYLQQSSQPPEQLPLNEEQVSLASWSINNATDVVGRVRISNGGNLENRAFLSRNGGTREVRVLDPQVTGSTSSIAYHINDVYRGIGPFVVGTSGFPIGVTAAEAHSPNEGTSPSRATMWSPAVSSVLSWIPGNFLFSSIRGVNDYGDAVGYGLNNNTSQAYLWQKISNLSQGNNESDWTVIPLGPLSIGAPLQGVGLFGINMFGEAAGTRVGGGILRGFVIASTVGQDGNRNWNTPWLDPGVQDPGSITQFIDINGFGDLIGCLGTDCAAQESAGKPAVWLRTGQYANNTWSRFTSADITYVGADQNYGGSLPCESVGSGQAWDSLNQFLAINDAGQIVGVGKKQGSTTFSAFLLDPRWEGTSWSSRPIRVDAGATQSNEVLQCKTTKLGEYLHVLNPRNSNLTVDVKFSYFLKPGETEPPIVPNQPDYWIERNTTNWRDTTLRFETVGKYFLSIKASDSISAENSTESTLVIEAKENAALAPNQKDCVVVTYFPLISK